MVKSLLGGQGGVAECFVFCGDKLCGLQNHEKSKQQPALSGSKSNFADEECYTISAVFNIWKTFVHKEIHEQNGAKTSLRLAHVKCHEPNRSETSGSVP